MYKRQRDDKKFTHFKKHPAVAQIPQVIPRNPFTGDNDQRQHLEWIAAIKENKPQLCYSRFAIAAQFTEILLLGEDVYKRQVVVSSAAITDNFKNILFIGRWIQASVSCGVMTIVFWAAMASFALWMTYSLGKASSAGQFNLALPRMALKKFSRCG